MTASWVTLLKHIDTPLTTDATRQIVNYAQFSKDLYRLALSNKVVLSYLSKIRRDGFSEKLFRYHSKRLTVLMNVLSDVTRVLEECGFRYVVFKTLRSFKEEVADIDILCLGDDHEYDEVVHAVGSRGYRLMEQGLFCTTFEDLRYRFMPEVMIDIYREVSSGPLIYLDKRLLCSVTTVRDVNGLKVRVLDPVAESLVVVGHSVIKERKISLADYLTVLHYLASMNDEQLWMFVELARRARLLYASKWFFTLVSYIHKIAHGFLPEKLVKLANILGGFVDLDVDLLGREPPFLCDRKVLMRVFAEKLSDPLFRASFVNTVPWMFKGRSLQRFARLIVGKP